MCIKKKTLENKDAPNGRNFYPTDSGQGKDGWCIGDLLMG